MPQEQTRTEFLKQTADLAHLLENTHTETGLPLIHLCRQSSVLLIFLRHSGCPFCRRALADLAKALPKLQQQGILPVLVHMGSQARLQSLLSTCGLAGVDRISDPERRLYRAFGLKLCSPFAFFSPNVLWQAFKASVLERHAPGRPDGNVTQLPGAFLIHQFRIARRVRHRSAAGRTDYLSLSASLPQDTSPSQA